MPTCTGSKIDNGNTGTAAGRIRVSVMMRPPSGGRVRRVAVPRGGPPCAVLIGGGDGSLRPRCRAVTGDAVQDRLAVQYVGVDGFQLGERGLDLVAGCEGVAADDLD